MFEEVVEVDEPPPLYEGFSTKCIHVGAACNLPQWFLVLFASLTLWSHSFATGVGISRVQSGLRAKAGNGCDDFMRRISASRVNTNHFLVIS